MQTIRSQSWQPDRQREGKNVLDFDPSFVLVGLPDRLFSCMHAYNIYMFLLSCMHTCLHTHTHACMHYIYYCDVYFLLPVLPILLLYSIIILQCSKQIHWVGSIDLYASCNDLQARRTTSDSRISYMELACMHAMMLPMPRDRSSTQSISISTCDHLPAILADIDPCK